jgi:hypothetical protein
LTPTLPDDPMDHHDRAGEREEGHAGPQRTTAQHVLHQDAHEEQDPEHGGGERQHDGVRAGAAAIGQDAGRQRNPNPMTAMITSQPLGVGVD